MLSRLFHLKGPIGHQSVDAVLPVQFHRFLAVQIHLKPAGDGLFTGDRGMDTYGVIGFTVDVVVAYTRFDRQLGLVGRLNYVIPMVPAVFGLTLVFAGGVPMNRRLRFAPRAGLFTFRAFGDVSGKSRRNHGEHQHQRHEDGKRSLHQKIHPPQHLVSIAKSKRYPFKFFRFILFPSQPPFLFI